MAGFAILGNLMLNRIMRERENLPVMRNVLCATYMPRKGSYSGTYLANRR
jgi:hypothetical protein